MRSEVFVAVPPEDIPLEPAQIDSTCREARRKSWAKHIRRVHVGDTLLNRCSELRRIGEFISQAKVIHKILDYIGGASTN
jgi:hypothetical protein